MTTPLVLSVGNRVDIKDKHNTWCMGIVIEIDTENASRFKIEYVGWAKHFADWIDINENKDRIAPLHTHTIPCIFNEPPPITMHRSVTCHSLYNNDIVFISTVLIAPG